MTSSSDESGRDRPDSLLHRLRHPRLRPKVLLGVLLAAVLALTAQFIISYRSTAHSLDQLAASRAAERLSAAVNVLADRRAALQQLAADTGSPDAVQHVAGHDLPWLRRQVIRRLATTRRVGFVAVLDSAGAVEASSAAPPRVLLASAVVRDAARGGSSAWTTWGGRLWLVAAAPVISDSAGAPSVGTVVVATAVNDAFARAIARAATSQVAFVLDGKVVAATDPKILPLVSSVAGAQAGHAGSVDTVHGFSGARRTLPLAGAQASMVAAEAHAPIAAAQRQLLRSTALAALGALAVAVVIALILARQVLKPLSALTGAAHAIAGGDLERRVVVSRVKRDEVNELGQAFNDMAEQVAGAHETLREAAIRDGLTGLLNQREFFRRLEQEVARTDRGGRPLSMLMADLDHLKMVNDTHGHLQGDAVLIEVARMIEANVREGDVVTRYAGDEFAVILPNADERQALAVAERVRAGAARVATAAGMPAAESVTLSVGVVTRPVGRWDPKQTVELADDALYRAKEAGRDRVEVNAARD